MRTHYGGAARASVHSSAIVMIPGPRIVFRRSLFLGLSVAASLLAAAPQAWAQG